MGMGTINFLWTQQPPAGTIIDYSNPICKNLVFAQQGNDVFTSKGTVGVGEAGVGVRTGITTKPAITTGVANSTVFLLSQCLYADGGNWWQAQNNSHEYWDTSSVWPNDLGLSVLSVTVYGQMIVGARDTIGTFRTAGIDVIPGNLTAANGRKISRAATIDSSLLVTGWGNGIKGGTSAGLQGFTFNPPTTSSGSPMFGIDTGYDTVVSTVLVLRWARVLSDSELVSINANPWQVYKP